MNDYHLIRSKRRTVSLQINADCSVTVRAPLQMPQTDIDAFVKKHRNWLQKHLAQMHLLAGKKGEFTFSDGDRFPLLGSAITLASGAVKTALFDGNTLFLPHSGREEAFVLFMKAQTQEVVKNAVQRFVPLVGAVPAGIRVTGAKTRWGSCSGQNRLCFSWRVACLPLMLADYIVVHELCHIKEHNHSHRFWAEVHSVLPDYKTCIQMLRDFPHQIPF